MPELIDKKRTEAKVFLIARLFIDRPDREVELVKAVIHKCCEEIDKQPSIEPEVRRGEWIEVTKHRDENGTILIDYECSECCAMVKDLGAEEIESELFCYNCGARMDGGANNG